MKPLALHHVGLAAVVLLLQACGSTPPLPISVSQPEPVQDEVAPVVLVPADPTSYEARERSRAAELERQGQLAEAALIWEVLSAIRPAQAEYRARLADANRAIAAAVAQRMQLAEQAGARGQADAAMSHYLAVLALQPDNQKAADALREAERERNRRNHLGKLTRHTLTRKAMADGDMAPLQPEARPAAAAQPAAQTAAAAAAVQPAPPRAPSRPLLRGAGGAERIEVEHASLLASQGEYGEAATMLERWLDGNRRDDDARHLLADVYFQHAESIAGSKPAAAIALLEKGLQLDRNNMRAAERLKQLKGGTARSR